MNSEKPLSNLDFMLRGAGTGYTVGATLPIAVLIAKLIKNKAYRDNFKQNCNRMIFIKIGYLQKRY